MTELLWALGRGTGVVALALFTASVVLGILTRSGRPAFGLPRFGVSLVHRNTALIGSVFIVIHVLTLLADPYAKLTLLDTIVPFLAAVKPLWVGLGTVAFDLLIAIVITGLVRQRIGTKVFRFIHWFTYAMWPIALLHAIGNGSDAGSGWFIVFALVCSLTVIGAVMWRLSATFIDYSHARGAEVNR